MTLLARSGLLLLVYLGGCLSSNAGDSDHLPADDPTSEIDLAVLVAHFGNDTIPTITLEESVVDAAMSFGFDLWEPTMDVSDSGVIYVTGHSFATDTMGAPVFRSADDGQTWSQLPFLDSHSVPYPLYGASPPPSTEIFIAAADDGWLWGLDITMATMPLTGWADNGTRQGYYNPSVFDDQQTVLQSDRCASTGFKDRPWLAYANGTLLMVNNGMDLAQIGILRVPPVLPQDLGPTPVGAGAAAAGAWWNTCAGQGHLPFDCFFPGIPDMRDDGLFVVPHWCYGELFLLIGDRTNVMDIEIKRLFPLTLHTWITLPVGQAGFDAAGTLYVVAMNNTAPADDGRQTGRLHMAVSRDGGATFSQQRFVAPDGIAIRHVYMDANNWGPGALVVWSQNSTTPGDNYDWYLGHLMVGPNGEPALTNAQLVIKDGPKPAADMTGASLGPDGRAYISTFDGTLLSRAEVPEAGATPLSVWIQRSGPTMPAE